MPSLAFSFFITQPVSLLWVSLPFLNSQSCNYSSSSCYRSIPLCPSSICLASLAVDSGLMSHPFWSYLSLLEQPSLSLPRPPPFVIRSSIHSSVMCHLPPTSTASPLFRGFQIFHFSPWLKALRIRKVCDTLHLSFIIISDVSSCVCLHLIHSVILNACCYCSSAWSLLFSTSSDSPFHLLSFGFLSLNWRLCPVAACCPPSSSLRPCQLQAVTIITMPPKI